MSHFPVTDHFCDLAGFVSHQENRRMSLKAYLLKNPKVASKIGLGVYQVPEGIHSIGPKNNIGDLLNADLLVSLLREFEIDVNGRKILDFGCSSGRLTRVLKSYLPDCEIFGCDPRKDAIDWANENIPNVQFFVSNEKPPISDIQKLSLDVITAVSVWSHFSEAAAINWFQEISKLLKPNGVLYFTVGGRQKYKRLYASGKIKFEKMLRCQEILDDGGYIFTPYHDSLAAAKELKSTNWGAASVGIKWYQKNLPSDLKILTMREGLLMGKQDVYLIKKNS